MRPTSPLLIVAIVLAPLAAAQDETAAKDPRNFTWIKTGALAIGGGGLTEADVLYLKEAGFGAIVDLRAEHEDPEAAILAAGMTFLDFPIASATNINATQLSEFNAWVREQNAAGRAVYAHCTNGWHRAAAFGLGFEMSDERGSFDHLSAELIQERPGSAMRAISALLAHEASITGKPGLAVVLVSPLSRPELGGEMPIEVHVYANGAPAAGASVRFWSEESKLDMRALTDENGRAAFTYKAPAASFMDHIYARASLSGHTDGADNVEFIFQQPASSRGPLEVVTQRDGDGVYIQATHKERPLPVRIIANAPGWTAFESSVAGKVFIPNAPTGAIEVRVVSWGSEGAQHALGEAVGTAPTPAPPTSAPTPAPTPAPSVPPTVAPSVPRGETKAEGNGRDTPTTGPSPDPEIPVMPRPDAGRAASIDGSTGLAVRYALIAFALGIVVGAYVRASRKRARARLEERGT